MSVLRTVRFGIVLAATIAVISDRSPSARADKSPAKSTKPTEKPSKQTEKPDAKIEKPQTKSEKTEKADKSEKSSPKTDKPAPKSDKSTEKSIDKPAAKRIEKSAEKVIEKPVEKAVEKSGGKVAVKIPAAREALALEFARQNHPELAALLEGLKQNAPREYHAALVDLDRAVERLTRVKERSADRHQTELADWKITSRIRLLAARWSMSSDPAVEAELRAALRERLDLRLAAQRMERDRLQSRTQKLDQQIEDLSLNADTILEKQLQDLRKSMPVSRAAAKNKSKSPDQPAIAKP